LQYFGFDSRGGGVRRADEAHPGRVGGSLGEPGRCRPQRARCADRSGRPLAGDAGRSVAPAPTASVTTWQRHDVSHRPAVGIPA
jgi:hypothetical protein